MPWPTSLRFRRIRARTAQQDADRGSSLLEAVIVIPVMVILTMIIIQMTLVWHGRHIAQAAADTGAAAAAGYQATAADGQQVAADFLAATAPNLLPGATVTADRTDTTATISVTSHVLTLVPFADFDVAASASAPVERFSP